MKKKILFNRFKTKIRTFLVQEEGAVAILTGLLFVLIIGFAALAIDASFWYSDRRQLQFAADAGAVGGAIALKTTGVSTITTYATNDIHLNNCTIANNCTIVAINHPPTSGPAAGNAGAVEVILSKPADTFLSGLFLTTAPTLQVRSVAGNAPTNNCVVSLAGSGVGVNVKGGGAVVSPNCGVYSNSTASNSVNVAGGGSITTNNINAVGGTSTAGGGIITTTGGITTGAAPTADPYGSIPMPTFSGCLRNNFSMPGGVQTIVPGVYCGGIKLTSNANLTMSPGVYFMDRGDFSASGQSTITANGVTIIMTSSTGTGFGTVTLNAGLTANMSAPTTGTTAGILFFGDRASSGLNEKFDGGTTQSLSGVLYFPTNNVDYNGQAGISGNPCFEIISNTVTFTGGSLLGNGCPSLSLGTTLFLE
jgi:hypothetical protein